MGVISTNRKPPSVFSIEDYVLDFWYDSPEENSDGEQDADDKLSTLVANRCRRRAGKLRSRRPGGLEFDGLSKGNSRRGLPGRSKQRRIDNALFLAQSVDTDEICRDLTDLLPDTTSAFDRLFLEPQNMQAWNDFIIKSEKEQESFLRFGIKEERFRGSTSSFTEIDYVEKQPKATKRHRKAAPAKSASQCYRRISASLRHMLASQHMPQDKIENFETLLTNFFTLTPDGVWVDVLESSFDRLLVHIVAQYLRLHSHSHDSGGSTRETTVENHYAGFYPPPESLCSYLRRRIKNA